MIQVGGLYKVEALNKQQNNLNEGYWNNPYSFQN